MYSCLIRTEHTILKDTCIKNKLYVLNTQKKSLTRTRIIYNVLRTQILLVKYVTNNCLKINYVIK